MERGAAMMNNIDRYFGSIDVTTVFLSKSNNNFGPENRTINKIYFAVVGKVITL